MLAVFFDPNHFEILGLRPQGTSFTAGYFLTQVAILLANQHHQQARDEKGSHDYILIPQDAVRRRPLQEKWPGHEGPRSPYSADLAIRDFWLLGCLTTD
jgi:hypothetical protein